jgi:hypothetical protein
LQRVQKKTNFSSPLVKPEWGRSTADILNKEGWSAKLKMYPGLEHSADPEEIDDVEKFLNETIPPLGDATPASL